MESLIRTGLTDAVSVPANGKTTVAVTFPKAFPAGRAVGVSATLFRGYGDATPLAGIAIIITQTSVTGFTVQISNAYTLAMGDVKIRWIAASE